MIPGRSVSPVKSRTICSGTPADFAAGSPENVIPRRELCGVAACAGTERAATANPIKTRSLVRKERLPGGWVKLGAKSKFSRPR